MDRRTFLTTGALAAVCSHVDPAFAYSSGKLRSQTLAFVEQSQFSGVVLVGRGPRTLYCEAFGLADRSTNRPVTRQTIFEAGSISKWIASIVTLHLVDRQKLDLHRPIGAYLPEFRKDIGDRVTLEHLLSHTSGIPNDIIPALRANPHLAELGLTQKEAIQRHASGDLRFPPGTGWDYSHSNWILVQAIVERVAEMNYRRFAAETLWKPLKLERSGIYSGTGPDEPDVALSYAAAETGMQPIVQRMPGFLEMAGGFYCSSGDLLHLMDAATTGSLLSRRSRQEMFRVRWPKENYALGCRVDAGIFGHKQSRFISEDGSNAGFRSVAYRIFEDGHTCILLNNTSMPLNHTGPFALQLLQTMA
ncbi:MAG: hypothetical protein BGO25_13665 [Acidobacteriales bacterium 59-55]|nr:beta-lactamase family protein [Terriglobales bacterium]OJV44133.1 MAG: hypothetical protein BGO25_13665 [Acidobacteriales bacterium 59-55]